MSFESVLSYVGVPLLIFLVRVVDVGMGTVRIIFISRGIRCFAAMLGFFEILIWLFAIGQIMQNLNSPVHYVAYAAGFGMGNFVGITIERKLSFGNRIVRIITKKDCAVLIDALKGAGYGITCIDGEGAVGPVKLIFSIVKRNDVEGLLKKVREHDPNAFFTVEDVRFVREAQAPFFRTTMESRMRRLGGFIQKKK